MCLLVSNYSAPSPLPFDLRTLYYWPICTAKWYVYYAPPHAAHVPHVLVLSILSTMVQRDLIVPAVPRRYTRPRLDSTCVSLAVGRVLARVFD